MDKYLIVPYEKLLGLLNLDEREREMDTLLAESANGRIKLITDRQIIAVKEWPIQSITAILDAKTENPIDCTPIFEKSETSHAIHIGSKFNGKKLGVVYRGGYEADEVPAVIEEAIIQLLFYKKAGLVLEKLAQAMMIPMQIQRLSMKG